MAHRRLRSRPPLLNLSLTATILVNLVYLAFDAEWFKSLCELGLLSISLAVTIRLYQVFPFDFSAYDVDWAVLARIVLIIAMVGVGIAMIVQVVKLIRFAIAAGTQSSSATSCSRASPRRRCRSRST